MGTLRRASVLSVGMLTALVVTGCGESTGNQAAASPKPVIVGLITKTDANPFFVKMRQGAEREAAAKGAVLMTGADTLARTIVAPAEMPIGILTAAIGAPFFLGMLLRQRGLVSL